MDTFLVSGGCERVSLANEFLLIAIFCNSCKAGGRGGSRGAVRPDHVSEGKDGVNNRKAVGRAKFEAVI